MSYKKTSILTEAKQIKEYVMKYGKIPSSCKLDNGVTLSPYSLAYLMSLLTLNPRKTDYQLNPVIRYNTTTHKDTINEKVTRTEYLTMINNFVKYCQEHKRVPSYITTKSSKTKVSFELFTYCLSKIVTFYKENNTLPNYCLFNKSDLQKSQTNPKNTEKNDNKSTSTNTYTQKNLLLNNGCTGMGQCTPYYCACNSLQQMFHKLTNKNIPETTIASWAGTTTNGTGHPGINTAIAQFNRKYGTKLKVEWKNFSDLGKTMNDRFQKLAELINRNDTGVFHHLYYRNKYGHYEVPYQINTNNKTIKVLNSLGDKTTNGYLGYIETRTYNTQAEYIKNTPGGQPSVCIIRK